MAPHLPALHCEYLQRLARPSNDLSETPSLHICADEVKAQGYQQKQPMGSDRRKLWVHEHQNGNGLRAVHAEKLLNNSDDVPRVLARKAHLANDQEQDENVAAVVSERSTVAGMDVRVLWNTCV